MLSSDFIMQVEDIRKQNQFCFKVETKIILLLFHRPTLVAEVYLHSADFSLLLLTG